LAHKGIQSCYGAHKGTSVHKGTQGQTRGQIVHEGINVL
jgi:hypothetical protein